MSSLRILLAGLLLGASLLHAQDNPGSAAASSAVCLDCHDFGPESPVHAVLAGSHGLSGDEEAMAGRQGCPDCHGASTDHADSPTAVAPEVSFGPRWGAGGDAQDERCLSCHSGDTARHWRDSPHRAGDVRCVACHDIHTRDRVLFDERQAEVCTVCHDDQGSGIHGMQARVSRNPPCSDCHSPHSGEGVAARMLDNRSQGCSHCHDLVRMATRASVSATAKSYHKVMTQPDRTCLDCHRGIAHEAAGSMGD